MFIRFTEEQYRLHQERVKGGPPPTAPLPPPAKEPQSTRSPLLPPQQQAANRATTPSPPSSVRETTIVQNTLDLLQQHPAVAWAIRMNTGGVRYGEEGENQRFVRFSVPGMSDIIGMLKDGRFLAIEVKRPGKSPTGDQEAFLLNVAENGGVAGWIDDASQVLSFLPSRVPQPSLLCPVFAARKIKRRKKAKAPSINSRVGHTSLRRKPSSPGRTAFSADTDQTLIRSSK